MRTAEQIAESILDASDAYVDVNAEPLVQSLHREAELLGVDPVARAAEWMLSLEASVEEDGVLSDEADLLRADLAYAAALVYVGTT